MLLHTYYVEDTIDKCYVCQSQKLKSTLYVEGVCLKPVVAGGFSTNSACPRPALAEPRTKDVEAPSPIPIENILTDLRIFDRHNTFI